MPLAVPMAILTLLSQSNAVLPVSLLPAIFYTCNQMSEINKLHITVRITNYL
ncbi:hypothetical protein Hanom_Chr07g00624301 [Helianthus anomalus]